MSCIGHIEEIPNHELPRPPPIRERMDKYVPGIPEGVPRRNGGVWLLCGSGGSGKSSMLLNFFKTRKLYRGKFTHVYLVTPEGSFNSVEKHPFQKHSRVYHGLTAELLEEVYQELLAIKEESLEEPEYACLILDDYADKLKDKAVSRALAQIIIKLRHLQCMLIITAQRFRYVPATVRAQVTNFSLFKPKNTVEFEACAMELLGYRGEDAIKLHDYVFSEPYSHLDVDTAEGLYYKNWNALVLHRPSSRGSASPPTEPDDGPPRDPILPRKRRASRGHAIQSGTQPV